jgi:hypothetical protein
MTAEHRPEHDIEAELNSRERWDTRYREKTALWSGKANPTLTAHFMHMPPPRRRVFYSRLAAAVADHGTLLVVAHYPSDLQTTIQRPPYPELLFTAEDLAADLGIEDTGTGEWEVVTSDAAPRTATGPDGNQVTIHDTVFRVRRR